MPFPIEEKLVVAVASSALFDLTESHAVFEEQGEEAYREHQRQKEGEILQPTTPSRAVFSGLGHLGPGPG
jgi:5'-nucleotidase